MEQNTIYTLPVLDMNSEGTGICKQDSMVIFVPQTVTGDTVRLKIRNVQKNYAIAECLEILSPSEYRRVPECPFFAECGGCTVQHITREMELSVKENTVRQALRRMHLEIAEGDVRKILSTEPAAYRNKAVFHFSEDGKPGYYARGTHTVMPGSTKCSLLPESFTEIAEYTEVYMRENASKFFPETLYLRQNSKGQCTVTVQTNGAITASVRALLQKYAEALQNRFPGCITGVLHSDHPKGKYAVPEYTVITGERYQYEVFHDLNMRISPEGFCQVNHKGAELLAETVLEFARSCREPVSGTTADLYCGSGFFGLHLAKAFPDWQIYGIEINADSIRDAEVNRTLNALNNIAFHCGDAASLTSIGTAAPVFVVIDPPRAGCSDKMRRQILELGTKYVVYVSCNPQTLARDLTDFCKGGYQIHAVQPVDMFPLTEHVETVVLMSKKCC